MNQRAEFVLGQQGEERMHITMGKRLSGCFPGASFPQGMTGMMSWYGSGDGTGNGYGYSMMGRWRGGNIDPNSSYAYGPFSMMGYGFGGFGVLDAIFMILWWVIIIAVIIAFVRWLHGRSHELHGRRNGALAILKERYAKGEIDKKEFEERKKNLA